MSIYICKCCKRPANVIEHPALPITPAYSDITCLSPGCPLMGVTTDSRDEQGIANRFTTPVTPTPLKPTIYPALPRERVSEQPGFIPLKTGDPIPHELRAALNVDAFVRDLRQAALEPMTEPE